MEKLMVVLLVFLALQAFKASSQSTTGWWSIDCGLESSHSKSNFRIARNSIRWMTDDLFAKDGSNTLVMVTHRHALEQMNSLRFFPNRTAKNCYRLPVYTNIRYILRAGFYYGNYDTLSSPPTFLLLLDGHPWATVTVPAKDPIFHEAIYLTKRDNLLVCLNHTREGQVPFISSLEAVPLWVALYPKMERNATFHLVTRINFGGDEIRFSGFGSYEKYNRVWKPQQATPPNCRNVYNYPDFGSQPENDPPYSVLMDAIQAQDASDPVILSVDLPNRTPLQACFIFYFAGLDTSPTKTDSRVFKIKIDGRETTRSNVTLEVDACKAVSIYPITVAGPSINITLTPMKGSTLPLIINAMEVFTRADRSSAVTRERFSSIYLPLIQLLSLIGILLV